MTNVNFYKGGEYKIPFELSAPGFSMTDDDFDIEVASPGKSVKGYKTPPAGDPGDIRIFKETTTVEEETTDQWYIILDTRNLNLGDLRMIATAHIVDAHAFDGVRSEPAVAPLGRLVKP